MCAVHSCAFPRAQLTIQRSWVNSTQKWSCETRLLTTEDVNGAENRMRGGPYSVRAERLPFQWLLFCSLSCEESRDTHCSSVPWMHSDLWIVLFMKPEAPHCDCVTMEADWELSSEKCLLCAHSSEDSCAAVVWLTLWAGYRCHNLESLLPLFRVSWCWISPLLERW